MYLKFQLQLLLNISLPSYTFFFFSREAPSLQLRVFFVCLFLVIVKTFPELQNGQDWQGPVEPIWSNTLLKQGHPRAGFSSRQLLKIFREGNVTTSLRLTIHESIFTEFNFSVN